MQYVSFPNLPAKLQKKYAFVVFFSQKNLHDSDFCRTFAPAKQK
jgi:hypothetical protein